MVRSSAVLFVFVLCAACGGDDAAPTGGTTTQATTSSTSGTEADAPEGADVDADGDGFPDDDIPDEPVVDHHAGATERLTVSGPDAPWASMSQADRELYMIGKVMPIMHEVFARQYGERAAEFGCETCHGARMREVSFAMPPRDGMPVPPVGTPAFARLERQFPESVRFMRDVVTPTMGTLLGIEGYTCNHCHPGGR